MARWLPIIILVVKPKFVEVDAFHRSTLAAKEQRQRQRWDTQARCHRRALRQGFKFRFGKGAGTGRRFRFPLCSQGGDVNPLQKRGHGLRRATCLFYATPTREQPKERSRRWTQLGTISSITKKIEPPPLVADLWSLLAAGRSWPRRLGVVLNSNRSIRIPTGIGRCRTSNTLNCCFILSTSIPAHPFVLRSAPAVLLTDVATILDQAELKIDGKVFGDFSACHGSQINHSVLGSLETEFELRCLDKCRRQKQSNYFGKNKTVSNDSEIQEILKTLPPKFNEGRS
ncbi:hypothetical protein B0H11DRAFT_1925831 [Mycena galericulata]|nr:hypothetical protein B0H11DRAFT_1925831 [Mycena galericulata]